MPQQRGSVDCGVYVIAACVSVITGRKLSPSICVPYWRQLLRSCLGESFELQLGLPDAQLDGPVDVTTRHRNAHGALQTASGIFDATDDMFQAVSALYASSSAEVRACAATSTAELEREIAQREHILDLHKGVANSSFHEEDTASQATLERALDSRRKRLQELTQRKDHAQFQHSSIEAMWRTISDLRSRLKSVVERREAETVAISRELLALEEYVNAARSQGIPGL